MQTVAWFLLVILVGTYFLLNYFTALVCNAYYSAHALKQNSENEQADMHAAAKGVLLDYIAFELETASAPVKPGGKTKDVQEIAEAQDGEDGAAKNDRSAVLQRHNGSLSTGGQAESGKGAEDSIRQTTLVLMNETFSARWCAPVLSCFAGLCGSLSKVWSYAVIKFKIVVGFLHVLVTFPNCPLPEQPNFVEHLESDDGTEKRSGDVDGKRKVAWLEVVMTVLAVVHTAALSTYRHEMEPKSKTLLQIIDMGMVIAFAGVEFLRVIAFGGIIKYLSRGADCQFDFFISLATLAAWSAGWNSWLQLSAFRLIKLLPILLALPGMRQASKVLHVAIGRPVDLTAGLLVFGCFLLVCSFGAWQILGKVMFENGADYFGSSMSSIVTTFGMAIGEEMKQVLRDGFRHIGAPALIFVLSSSILLGKIVGQLFTAVFLANFVVSDKDRVAYQLQFEKLRRLWGWSEEKAQHEWLTSNRPHTELLHESGQLSILHPDAAGIFRRITKFGAAYDGRRALALASVFPAFSTLRRWIRRVGSIMFCHSCKSQQSIKRYLSILVLRGQRLHLLESPNVRPHVFIRVRLEGEVRSQGEGSTSLEQADSRFEAPTGTNQDLGELGAAIQTTISETWDPEWREELFVGPLVKGQAAGLGTGDVVLEVWCAPELNRNRTNRRKSLENIIQEDDEEEARVPDVLLGSCRQPLSHLSQYHAEIAVLPLQDGKYVDENLCENTERRDLKEKKMDFKKGPTITVRFMVVESKVSKEGDSEALASCWRWVARAAKSKMVDSMMLLLIIGCTLFVFAESNSERDSTLESVKQAIDLMFLGICILEILVKIAVFGAFSPASGSDEAYLKSGWHQFDALIAIAMILALVVPSIHEALSRVYVFRVIRLLRPLMSISRFSGLRTASMAVVNSFMVIFALLSVTAFFLCAWSIASLYAFTGKLDRCVGNLKVIDLSKLHCSHFTAGQDDIIRPLVWGPPEWENFDHFRMAFLTMFRALNSNGWTRVVQQVLAAGHIESKMSGFNRRHAEENAIPFLILQVLGNLIILQCIMAIMINAIDVSRRRAFLTRAQRALNATKTMAMQARNSFVKEPAPGGIKRLQRIIHHDLFENFATVMIMLNVLVLLTEHHDASEDHIYFKEFSNLCFIIWYTVEQVLKMLALSTSYIIPIRYGQRTIAWMNIFDLTVTLCAILEVSGLLRTSGIHVLRSIRVIRLLELIPSVRTLIHATRKSFKVILGCFSILLITSSTYAVVGSAFFADVKYGEHLNRQSNFDTPLNSLFVMCRIIGGEDWPSIMDELAVSPPLCTAGRFGDCGSLWALPFLMSFNILVHYFFLPLCLASLVCCFFETVGQDTVILRYDMRLFVRTWRILDPNRTGFIDAWKFRSLLERLVAAKSLLGIDPVRRAKKIDGLILHLEKTRRASIDAGRQAVTDGMSFMDVIMTLICAYKYPWCVFGGVTSDQGITDDNLSAQGGVLEVWARRRNAITIRDALLLPPGERLAGSIGASAGKVWGSFEGLLHVWIIGAHNLPNASLHGSYCNVTLLRAEEKWKRRRKHAALSEPKDDARSLDEEVSSGHYGPLFGWLNEHALGNPSPTTSTADKVRESQNEEGEEQNQTKRGRGTTFNTKVRYGSRNPEWNDHFVIPIVNPDCSILISAAEDSAGAGHKMFFGSVEVTVDSLMKQPPGVFRFRLSAAESHHAEISEGKNEHGSLSQNGTKFLRSLFGSYHESSEITVRFLYKRMDEARLQVAAQAFKCLDAAFEPEEEPVPSRAATLPSNPEQLYFDFSTPSRVTKPGNNTESDLASNVPRPDWQTSPTVLSSFSRSQKSLQLECDVENNGVEMGVRAKYSGPEVSDMSQGNLVFSNLTEQESSGAHEMLESKVTVNRLAPVIPSQLWSYFGGTGKLDKGFINMSRRRASSVPAAPSVRAHDHPAATAPTTIDFNGEVPCKPAPAKAVETMQVVAGAIDTPSSFNDTLAPLEEPCEDEDESRPVPRQMEIGELPTLSGHVTTLLSTPRGAPHRRILYAGGRGPVYRVDDASAEGSMDSNSLGTLRGIVRERRELVEEKLRYLRGTFFTSISNLTPRGRQHHEDPGPNLASPQLTPVSELEQTQGARRMSREMSSISQELMDSSKELSFVSQQLLHSKIAQEASRNEKESPKIKSESDAGQDSMMVEHGKEENTPISVTNTKSHRSESKRSSKKKGKSSGREKSKGEGDLEDRERRRKKKTVLTPQDSGITVSAKPAMPTMSSHDHS